MALAPVQAGPAVALVLPDFTVSPRETRRTLAEEAPGPLLKNAQPEGQTQHFNTIFDRKVEDEKPTLHLAPFWHRPQLLMSEEQKNRVIGVETRVCPNDADSTVQVQGESKFGKETSEGRTVHGGNACVRKPEFQFNEAGEDLLQPREGK